MADDLAKPSEWIKLIQFALEKLFGDHVPSFIGPMIGGLLLIAILCAVVVAIMVAAAKARDIWIEKFRPLSYSPEEKTRSRNSRLFANHVLREINQRNLSENWKDEEFAELEAEVEAQGQRRHLLPFREIFRVPTGIRREPSLTRALERSSERLILLEGDPGAGKSVALRHVAQSIAFRASTVRHSGSILPIFVNLKELKSEEDEPVDRDLIRKFILQSLNRINDRFIDEFLDAEFDRGLQDGRWVFLFDSFDEIPAVLSSTEADVVIQKYSQAISDFLGGLNSCRGVVASRFYRGPSQTGWQKFRILELSSDRQEDLIDKALLKPAVATRLRGDLSLASGDIQSMAKNPMLLGLLCEHMRLGNDFPTLAYEVFEKYFGYRFERDAARVLQRYGLAVETVRKEAEQLAFAMASSPALGLSPSRKLLQQTLAQMGIRWGEKKLNRLLDALEYMKIGRSDRDGVSVEERQFTFSHRRFQEFFATCVVIQDSEAVTSRQLLLDARWRETAVVLCQTGRPEAVQSLLEEANRIVLRAHEQIERDAVQSVSAEASASGHAALARTFAWPDGVLHVLGILQAGFGTSKREMPAELRQAAALVLKAATWRGSFLDQKFALEVAGVAPQDTLLTLMRQALQSDSQWLNDVIYRQVARLSTIPPDVLEWVRIAILRIALGQGSHRRRDALHAHLARLHRSSDLLNALRLAYVIRPVDFAVLLFISAFLYMTPPFENASWQITVPALGVPAIVAVVSWRLYAWRGLFDMTAVLRVYFYVILLLAGLGLGFNWQAWSKLDWRVWLAAASIYLMCWPFAAIVCVKHGTANGVAYWPMIPLQSLPHLRVLQMINGIFSKAGAIVFCSYAAVGIAWYFLRDVLDVVLERVAVPMFSVFGIGLLIVSGIFLVRAWKDYRIFREFRRGTAREIDVSDLSEWYWKFSTGLFKLKFLNLVRTQGLASRTSNMTVLRKFAEQVAFDGDQAGSAGSPGWSGLLSVLDFSVSGYKIERRDEVYILIEDLMRLGSSSQVVFPFVDNTQSNLDRMTRVDTQGQH
jgi:hypothetical protein